MLLLSDGGWVGQGWGSSAEVIWRHITTSTQYRFLLCYQVLDFLCLVDGGLAEC